MKLLSKKWLKKRDRSFLPRQPYPSLTRFASSRADVSNFDTRVPYSLWSNMAAALRPPMSDSQPGHSGSALEGPYITTDSLPSGAAK